jgi:hypothetical protein
VIPYEATSSEDAGPFAGWIFNNLMSDRATLLHNRERIDFTWEGFAFDNRELWEIPEVVAFVRDLNRRWPCALYFMNRSGHGLRVMQFCLAGATRTGSPGGSTNTVRVETDGLARLLEDSWYPGLNQICELAGLGPDDVRMLGESAERYLRQGPLGR